MNFRATLYGMVRTAVDNAIKNDDQKYARQLASFLERQIVRLRLKFGGQTIWQRARKSK
jgi:hypothetical protein